VFCFSGMALAQELAFTNPKVQVQVSSQYYSVQSAVMPDHRWERGNPNTPSPQNIRVQIPRQPAKASRTSPVPSRGPIAIAINGVVFFGPEDAHAKRAIENHGLGSCQRHPAPIGMYHYHSTPACVHKDRPGQHSPVIGYAFDGFKIYGLQGEKGRAPRDLDSCNGHKDGERGYQYHTTKGFPYVLGCRFHGVLVPNAALRSQIVPGEADQATDIVNEDGDSLATSTRTRMSWAQ